MTTFHDDMFCGACKGPLESDRNAICHKCAPESQWFEQAAAVQNAVDAIKAKLEEAYEVLRRHSADSRGRPCPCEACIRAKEIIAEIKDKMGR